MQIEGGSWRESSADVCIAGLGWVSFGVTGVVDMTVWTHKGVGVTSRQAMLPDYATDFERPGWSENSKALFKEMAKGASATGKKQERSFERDIDDRPARGRSGTGRGGSGRGRNSGSSSRGGGRGYDQSRR